MIVRGRVIFPEYDEDVTPQVDELEARLDDAFWAVRIRGAFSWRLWYRWWVERRWLEPRDIRKR